MVAHSTQDLTAEARVKQFCNTVLKDIGYQRGHRHVLSTVEDVIPIVEVIHGGGDMAPSDSTALAQGCLTLQHTVVAYLA